MKPQLVKAIEQVVALKMKAVDKLMEELVEPLSDIGNPEKLLGKNYNNWSQDDLQKLIGIYGTKEPNPLSDLIFRRELQKVQELEKEVR